MWTLAHSRVAVRVSADGRAVREGGGAKKLLIRDTDVSDHVHDGTAIEEEGEQETENETLHSRLH